VLTLELILLHLEQTLDKLASELQRLPLQIRLCHLLLHFQVGCHHHHHHRHQFLQYLMFPDLHYLHSY
jgi:hypothetical protein